MKFDNLYSKDQNGNIRVFELKVEANEKQHGVITRNFGQLGGAMTEKITVVEKGKNIGKSNATSALQQALRDAGSIWRKKKDEGNFSLKDLGITPLIPELTQNLIEELKHHLPDIKTNEAGTVQPMLLYEARTEHFPDSETERKSKKRYDVEFPCIVQLKRDGICTIADENGLTTRGGKDSVKGGESWNSICSHIVHELKLLRNLLLDKGMQVYPFHGETYLHGLDLQQIQSATKKRNEHSRLLELYIFDVVIENTPMHLRRMYILDMIEIAKELTWHYIKFVPGVIVKNEEKLLDIETGAIDNGYEGLVVRNPMGLYKIGGRSRDVLKMVRLDKSTALVIGVEPMEKDPKKGKFVCLEGNQKFFVTPGTGFDAKDREDILSFRHRWINTRINIIHRGYTQDGIPRCATAPKK